MNTTTAASALRGKVAVVTGGGRGLGLAYARGLAAAGAAVLVNDIHEETASNAVAAIVADGGRAAAHVGAVGETAVADALADAAVTEFGRLDILVTNAGILRDAVLWKMSDDDFDEVIRVHLRGTFTCVRAAAKRLREQDRGGRIICVGSPTGQVGNFGQTNYAAAKAGIVGMVRTWSLELARANITVNALIPVAATGMTEKVPFLAPYAAALAAGDQVAPYARRELSLGRAARGVCRRHRRKPRRHEPGTSRPDRRRRWRNRHGHILPGSIRLPLNRPGLCSRRRGRAWTMTTSPRTIRFGCARFDANEPKGLLRRFQLFG